MVQAYKMEKHAMSEADADPMGRKNYPYFIEKTRGFLNKSICCNQWKKEKEGEKLQFQKKNATSGSC